MDRTRRTFLTGTTALAAGQLAGTGWTAEPAFKNGKAAITRPEAEALVNSGMKGGFTCVRTAESVDGPYYAESSLRRRDLREGRAGVNLKLGVRVMSAMMPGMPCSPLAGAIVDLWQADAHGLYSNAGDDLQNENTVGKTFLRGHQITDAAGYVEFDTVAPGWEVMLAPVPGGAVVRTSHIHVKVFHESKIVTTQLYFPDTFLDELYASVDPYRTHREMKVPGGPRPFVRVRNGEDRQFVGDASTPLAIERVGNGIAAQANIGVATIGSLGVSSRFR
jgi:protocatechuate 3,4-dioxygenase beta subunit